MLTKAQIGQMWADAKIAFCLDKVKSTELAFARAVEAAATAEATALLVLAQAELDNGTDHAEDCMSHWGGKCKCQRKEVLAKIRAWLGEAQKGDGHHG